MDIYLLSASWNIIHRSLHRPNVGWSCKCGWFILVKGKQSLRLGDCWNATLKDSFSREVWLKMCPTVIRNTHFITSSEAPWGPTLSMSSHPVERWAGSHFNSSFWEIKDYVRRRWDDKAEKERERAGRDRLYQDREVTLHPALHTACIKAITLQGGTRVGTTITTTTRE